MRRTFLFFFWVFLGIQVIRVDYDIPESVPENDLIALMNPPEEVANILTKSCYDCHSHKTEYPWYSQVAPFSWWTTHHVAEARMHFNFSKWNEMSQKDLETFAEEAEYEINEDEMPLPPYTWIHSGADLAEGEKEIMIAWLNDVGY